MLQKNEKSRPLRLKLCAFELDIYCKVLGKISAAGRIIAAFKAHTRFACPAEGVLDMHSVCFICVALF